MLFQAERGVIRWKMHFNSKVDESIRMEMAAGWVSVLMAMKAAVDHGVDLRNHDESRTWGDGYADN